MMTDGTFSTTSSSASHFLHGRDLGKALTQFEREGCLLVENAVDSGFCETVRKFIDTYSSDDVEKHYHGTEIRIWDTQNKHPLLAKHYEKCNATVAALFGKPLREKTLMAIRNLPVASNDSDVNLGRWHLDSFFKQVKVFLFLSDTSEQSGPFEYLPGSHADTFKYRNLLSGKYVKPIDILLRKRAYQSLDEGFIDELGKQGYEAAPVICKAGTAMIVNTSAIHRARPCLEGSRYALTTYYY